MNHIVLMDALIKIELLASAAWFLNNLKEEATVQADLLSVIEEAAGKALQESNDD